LSGGFVLRWVEGVIALRSYAQVDGHTLDRPGVGQVDRLTVKTIDRSGERIVIDDNFIRRAVLKLKQIVAAALIGEDTCSGIFPVVYGSETELVVSPKMRFRRMKVAATRIS
jgi:hypothetical protein